MRQDDNNSLYAWYRKSLDYYDLKTKKNKSKNIKPKKETDESQNDTLYANQSSTPEKKHEYTGLPALEMVETEEVLYDVDIVQESNSQSEEVIKEDEEIVSLTEDQFPDLSIVQDTEKAKEEPENFQEMIEIVENPPSIQDKVNDVNENINSINPFEVLEKMVSISKKKK